MIDNVYSVFGDAHSLITLAITDPVAEASVEGITVLAKQAPYVGQTPVRARSFYLYPPPYYYCTINLYYISIILHTYYTLYS